MQFKQPYDNSVTFATFIKDFAGSLKVNEHIAKAVYNEFVKIIADYLRQGKVVFLFKFGTLKLQILPPKTNVTKVWGEINMKERRIVRFRASRSFKKMFYDNYKTNEDNTEVKTTGN